MSEDINKKLNKKLNELKNLISSAITKLKLLENNITNERQKIFIAHTTYSLDKALMKIDMIQEKNPYESVTKEMRDIAIELRELHKDREKNFERIEKLTKKLIEMFG